MRTGGWLACGVGLVWLAAGTGCTLLSDSSRSLSKSVSSPSTSSSEGGDPAYRREIRNYSYTYARAGGDPKAFARGLSAMAARGGVHDWEEHEETCRSVGEGFREANATKSYAETAMAEIVPAGSECNFWMRAGYHER